MRGGEPDFEKASIVLLQDYRTGALGRISLETPESRSAMLGKLAPSSNKTSKTPAPDVE